jgi:catechol 2,3-dioxygenase-like lactoylglutathione lyase family enzyme
MKAGAVIFAKDLSRISRFYEGLFGFEVVNFEQDHVVLDSPNFMLTVHSIPEDIAATIEIADPPVLRSETAVKLVFFVPSLCTVREAAGTLGGGLNPPELEWCFQGNKVCDGYDPEGNVLQFREFT